MRHKAERHYSVKNLYGNFFTDTMFADVKYIYIDIESQIYSYKCGLSSSHTTSRVNGEQVGLSLIDFISDFKAHAISHLMDC